MDTVSMQACLSVMETGGMETSLLWLMDTVSIKRHICHGENNYEVMSFVRSEVFR